MSCGREILDTEGLPGWLPQPANALPRASICPGTLTHLPAAACAEQRFWHLERACRRRPLLSSSLVHVCPAGAGPGAQAAAGRGSLLLRHLPTVQAARGHGDAVRGLRAGLQVPGAYRRRAYCRRTAGGAACLWVGPPHWRRPSSPMAGLAAPTALSRGTLPGRRLRFALTQVLPFVFAFFTLPLPLRLHCAGHHPRAQALLRAGRPPHLPGRQVVRGLRQHG